MNIRKNIYTLTDAQLQDFKDAVNAIKTNGTYDTFIERHHHSMMTATPWRPRPNPDTRNVAHRGPRSCPGTATSVASSSWRSRPRGRTSRCRTGTGAEEAAPLGAPLWNTNPAQRIYIGGDGTGPGGTVTTGPFAGWIALVEDISGNLVPRPGGILRDLGAFTNGDPDFPDRRPDRRRDPEHMTVYDTSPWRTSSNNSFRNRLEGWRHNPGRGRRTCTTGSTSGSAGTWDPGPRRTTRSFPPPLQRRPLVGAVAARPSRREEPTPASGGPARPQPERRDAAPDHGCRDAGEPPSTTAARWASSTTPTRRSSTCQARR